MLSFQRLDLCWSKVDMSKHYKNLKVRRLIEQALYERGFALLEAAVAMLTKMGTVESST